MARQPSAQPVLEHSALSTHTQVGSPVQYYCLYQTARLTYSATEISTP